MFFARRYSHPPPSGALSFSMSEDVEEAFSLPNREYARWAIREIQRVGEDWRRDKRVVFHGALVCGLSIWTKKGVFDFL